MNLLLLFCLVLRVSVGRSKRVRTIRGDKRIAQSQLDVKGVELSLKDLNESFAFIELCGFTKKNFP